jgi:hypothetical protein
VRFDLAACEPGGIAVTELGDVATAIKRPRRSELSHIQWLLTAAAHFEPLGFRRLGRGHASPAIEHSSQFKSLCPSTAVLVVKP